MSKSSSMSFPNQSDTESEEFSSVELISGSNLLIIKTKKSSLTLNKEDKDVIDDYNAGPFSPHSNLVPTKNAGIPFSKTQEKNKVNAIENTNSINSPSNITIKTKKSQPNLKSVHVEDDEDDDDDDDDDNAHSFSQKYYFWDSTEFICPFINCSQKSSVSEKKLPQNSKAKSTNSVFTDPLIAKKHLRTEHHVEIVDFLDTLPYLKAYLNFFLNKIIEAKKLNLKRTEKQDFFFYKNGIYLLGKSKFDLVMRKEFLKEKMNEKLAIQTEDRQCDSPSVLQCLFCRNSFKDRIKNFSHMFKEHGFHIGLPDNLVEVEKFLQALKEKITNAQCIYCEKLFINTKVLRSHMRKKKHFRVHSQNHFYDKFYLCNYAPKTNTINPPTESTKKNLIAIKNVESSTDEETYDDWSEEEEIPSQCLFESKTFKSPLETFTHMNAVHGFNFKELSKSLTFYQKIKFINYIRKCSLKFVCFHCSKKFDREKLFLQHFEKTNCIKTFKPKFGKDSNGSEFQSFWKDSNYLFPTIENDPLLFDFGEESEFSDEDHSFKLSDKEIELLKLKCLEIKELL
ncbi:hypothetical protein HDU92_002246 [Lobulomyces angularis]|nr:hypothetical protein HDU92_002246 [Lobulomyces angularis]